MKRRKLYVKLIVVLGLVVGIYASLKPWSVYQAHRAEAATLEAKAKEAELERDRLANQRDALADPIRQQERIRAQHIKGNESLLKSGLAAPKK